MKCYILERILFLIPIVVLISIATFALLHLVPGGPAASLMENPKVSADDLARLRENLGLDKPLWVQYVHWFDRAFLHFDFGKSYVTGQPVNRMILERLPATLELMATAFIIALIAALVVGVLWSVKAKGPMVELFAVLSTMGMSLPVFWLGIMAIALFSVKLGVLPAGGTNSIGSASTLPSHIKHLILPSFVLSLAYFSTWSRYIKAGMSDVVNQNFIRTARAKGLGELSVVFKHALKNAVLPFLPVALMQMPTIFTGAVVTETVFSWPGMGRLFYEGLQRHDYTRVLGIVVIASFLVVIFNLLADVLVAAVDPRIKANGRGVIVMGREESPALE